MTFKQWLITLMVLLLVADIAILLDIPVLRQVLSFLCFSTIPGLLILYILKLNTVGFLKKFLLSIGLSLSFLLFFGLLVNTLFLWFGYRKPLSTLSLVISLSLGIAILCFGAYWRNRAGIQFSFISRLREDLRNKYLSLLLFPLLFPLLSVIGRRVIEGGGSNIILLVLFFLIPCYVVWLMWQSKKTPPATYPIAIGMISLALLLVRGITSNYLWGGDIYSEYNSFQIVSSHLHWSMAEGTLASASLSISLLPAIFQSLLGINPVYMYKVVFLLLIALVPVIGYATYEKYTGPLYGFLAAFFFMAQYPFIYLLSGVIRVGIALIPFSLAIMVLFDDHISSFNKRVLFLIFLASLVVAYYMLPVVFLALLFVVWLVPKIWKGSFGHQSLSLISAIILPSVLIFFWWGQLTASAFKEYIYYARQIVVNLSNLFVRELRGGDIVSLYTLPSQLTFVQAIPGYVQRLTFVIIAIGVVSSLVRKEQRLRLGGYVLLMTACLALLIAFMILPWVSKGYAPDRLYIQLLIVLAPAFIAGCEEIANGIRLIWAHSARLVRFTMSGYSVQSGKLRFLSPILIGVILVSAFFSNSHLYHQYLFPAYTGEIFDAESLDYTLGYVHDSEVRAAGWLGANNLDNSLVYVGNMRQRASGDIFEYTDYGVNRQFHIHPFAKENPANSYVFLQALNVVDGQVIYVALKGSLELIRMAPLSDYAYFYANKNKIYAGGSAEIYK